MNSLLASILLLISASMSICAQTTSYAPRDYSIIPPSPEVASAIKAIDIPIDYFKGIPDISLPIYTIKEGSLSVPIVYTIIRQCHSKANGEGKLVTPDGDTIPDVLMTSYIRHGATVAETDFSNSFYRTQDSTMLYPDVIGHKIITDSITHRIIHQCWYASGYRYPIVEIRHYLTYYYGIQNDSVTIALYHSPASQKYNLPSDPENEAIRLDGYFNSGIGPRTKGVTSTKSNTRAKTYQTAGDYQDCDGSESMDVCTDLMTQNSCEVYPTDVENSTIIRLNLYETMQIKAILYNSSGKVMWKNDNSYSPGTYSIDCDMGSLADGNYLMNVAIGKNNYNYKLVKR